MKTFTVIGVYASDYQRFAESVEALNAASAARKMVRKCDKEGGELIVAGVIEGDHMMVG